MIQVRTIPGQDNEGNMSEKTKLGIGRNKSEIYIVKLRGHLGNQWADWFEGLEITLEDGGVTSLTGPLVDQAALHGLLKKIRDLGITLLSINRV